MTIIFARHGETTGDVEDRFGGDYDDSLSETGREQVQQLAQKLKNQDIELILNSPLSRAIETATIVKDSLDLICRQEVFPEFKERNQYGRLTGMIKSEAREKYPEDAEALKDYHNTIAEAEANEDFEKRVEDGFDKLVTRMKESGVNTVFVVWHGGPMRVLFRKVLKLGELKKIDDCAFVVLKSNDDEWKVESSQGLVFDF